MGNDVANTVEGFPLAWTVKVHAQMCSELLKMVIMVSNIFPEIEAARPRCSSGINALCALKNGIVKAKSLLQHCSESSVLYLAFTGDALIFRCKKSRNLMEQSLGQIQNMVPVVLAAKISGIISDLTNATFCLEPPEEEAGKLLHELLHQYSSKHDSTEEIAFSVIQSVSSRLHITSQKALLTEKKSIKKLLDEFGENEPNKRKVLLYFLNLLNKYGKYILKEQENDVSEEHAGPLNYQLDEIQVNMFSWPVPPKEFICPLTSRLMYDPVDIASGHTYERMWIKKWFDEGNDTCPKSKMKLAHLSFTSNIDMKDLILKWCAKNGVSSPDCKYQEEEVKCWENSINSIASLSSSINDLNLPLDFQNSSFGSCPSFGSSHGSCTAGSKIHTDVKSSYVSNEELFTKFSLLPWSSQKNVIKDLKRLMENGHTYWSTMPLGKLTQLLLRFLKNSFENGDVEAQISGCHLLLRLVQKESDSLAYIKEDAYSILALFLDTDVTKQALSILEMLSIHQQCGLEFAASGALVGIFNILDSQRQDLLEPILKILCNLSSNINLCSFITPSHLLFKIIPLLENNTLARCCVMMLKNLSNIENVRMSIVETDGCICAIAKLLGNDSCDIQEHAVFILLSLCKDKVLYRSLFTDEGIIPDLVSLSVNGNERAKAMAREMLRLLKEEFGSAGENSGSDVATGFTKPVEKGPPQRAPGLFRKIFSKLKVCFN